MFYKSRKPPIWITSESEPKPPTSIFNGVKRALSVFLDNPTHLEQSPRPSLLFFTAFLNKDTLRDFFLWFVNSPLFVEAVADSYQKAFIPRHDEVFKIITDFRQKEKSGTRYENTHSLTEKEYIAAYNYLNTQNKQMLMAAYVIEQGVLAYVETLGKLYPSFHPSFKKVEILDKAELAFITIEAAASSNSVTQEFITTLAYPAARNRPNPWATGLNLAFSKHSAFDSSNGTAIRTCPFKSPFAHLLNMTLVQNENGQYHEGEPQHAGLILSLMVIIKNWEQSPPVEKIMPTMSQ